MGDDLAAERFRLAADSCNALAVIVAGDDSNACLCQPQRHAPADEARRAADHYCNLSRQRAMRLQQSHRALPFVFARNVP